MDLSKLKALDTIDVTVRHAAFEEGKEPIFTMAGPCHPATKKAEKARMDAVMAARGKSVDLDAITSELLASRILGWKNVVWEGEDLPWSPENALKLLRVPAVMKLVSGQLADGIKDDEVFFFA